VGYLDDIAALAAAITLLASVISDFKNHLEKQKKYEKKK
jgi:uncharacterized membrane protein YkvA (DUF1232 family)